MWYFTWILGVGFAVLLAILCWVSCGQILRLRKKARDLET